MGVVRIFSGEAIVDSFLPYVENNFFECRKKFWGALHPRSCRSGCMSFYGKTLDSTTGATVPAAEKANNACKAAPTALPCELLVLRQDVGCKCKTRSTRSS